MTDKPISRIQMAQKFQYKLIRFLAIWIGCSVISCSGNQIELDVLLSVNETTNPLLDIAQAKDNGTSRGVFFILDELNDSPVSIDDVKSGGDSHSQPDQNSTSIGLDPLQDQFAISTSTLNSDSFYRITMIAKDVSGIISHKGVGDCPIKLLLKNQNMVKICFGKNDPSNPPLCAGLTTFSDCPKS